FVLGMNRSITTPQPSTAVSVFTTDVAAGAVQRKRTTGLRHPSLAGTAAFLIGLLLTGVSLHGETASGVARYAAIGCGVSLALSLIFELRTGVANLLSSD